VSFQNPRIELPHEDPIAEINLLQRLSENQHARHICPALLGVFESPSGWLFAVSENCGNDLTFVAPSKQAYARTIMHSVVRHCLVLKQQCGLSHSDLSLENICLKDGDNVKLIDFGLAAPALKSTTRRSGKLMYMAPEIFQAETYYPAEADVWALGVCLFLITYGQPPQKSVNGPWWLTFLEQAQDYQTKAPSLLHSLMACMLTAKPSERIPLEQILSHPWFL
jgi:serine/threonine protein kinase